MGTRVGCELAKEGSRGHWSLWRDEPGADLPSPGKVKAQSRKGHAWGQDWIPVEFQASEPSCLLVLQSMEINKGD